MAAAEAGRKIKAVIPAAARPKSCAPTKNSNSKTARFPRRNPMDFDTLAAVGSMAGSGASSCWMIARHGLGVEQHQ